jgi:maltooligosyltrehalose trehalohydrolase
VEVVLQDGSVPAVSENNGYFSVFVPKIGAGTDYRYRLEGGDAFPDPASRFQPEGPHGPSRVVDPAQYTWNDSGWRGIPIERAVVYEMHIGTFTPEGTWAAAEALLPRLAQTGINVLEVMPVADFSGRFGWGYDGSTCSRPRVCMARRMTSGVSSTVRTPSAWP